VLIWDKIKNEFANGKSAVNQIILVNLAVSFLVLLVSIVAKLYKVELDQVLKFVYLPSNLDLLLVRPWTFITYTFVHTQFFHILSNLLFLYFIGRILENYLSPQKIWTIFMGGALLGGILFVVAFNVFPAFEQAVDTRYIIGASAGVSAIIAAAGLHLPYFTVRLFGSFKVEMRWIAVAAIFLNMYSFSKSTHEGQIIAHLSGVAFGLLYILWVQGKIKLPKFKLKRKKKSPFKEVHVDESNLNQKKPKPNQQEIDAILDKISRSGYSSLTSDEKELLFKASE
jgi:membrane associated rhomboid family serine protease